MLGKDEFIQDQETVNPHTKKPGRPPKLSPEQESQFIKYAKELDKISVCQKFGISTSTYDRLRKRLCC